MEPPEQENATPGDRVIIHGHHQGERARDGKIIEVSGSEGGPPYLVRWADGHESSVYPSSDLLVEHVEDDA
jgi:Domain of unknown function (DUF1918)